MSEDRIVGRSWEEIQAMQQRQQVRPTLTLRPKPTATPEDIHLLRTQGLEKLKADGMYGIIDRLITSGLVEAD